MISKGRTGDIVEYSDFNERQLGDWARRHWESPVMSHQNGHCTVTLWSFGCPTRRRTSLLVHGKNLSHSINSFFFFVFKPLLHIYNLYFLNASGSSRRPSQFNFCVCVKSQWKTVWVRTFVSRPCVGESSHAGFWKTYKCSHIVQIDNFPIIFRWPVLVCYTELHVVCRSQYFSFYIHTTQDFGYNFQLIYLDSRRWDPKSIITKRTYCRTEERENI